MKQLITLIIFLVVQHVFSQTTPVSNTTSLCESVTPLIESNVPQRHFSQPRFQIVIENLPSTTGESSEFSYDLQSKGVYTFSLSPDVSIPDNYTLILKDVSTGNIFDLQSVEKHSFSVNRNMTKRFTIQLHKTPSLSMNQKSLLNMLLL